MTKLLRRLMHGTASLLLLPIILMGCDSFGSKKIKTIVELSPRLSASNTEIVKLYPQIEDISSSDFSKFTSYTIAKNKIISEPVFAKGNVYFVDNKGYVGAFSIKDKSLLWTNSSNRSNYNLSGGGIAINDDKLYLTNGTKNLVILDRLTGNELLRKEFPDIIKTKPVILQENIILIQTASNQVFAYDVNNARLIWQHEGPFETLTSTTHISPIVASNQVLINYNSGFLVSLTKSGEERWALSLNEEHDIGLPNFEQSTLACNPVIDNEYIYIAVTNGRVLKININNGQVAWQMKAPDVQSMSLNGNNLMITNNARQLALINTENGGLTWVGELEVKSKKRSKIVKFLNPIITQKNNRIEINVISGSSVLYSFAQNDNGYLPAEPIATKINGDIQYSGMTCCGKIYLLTDRKILLFSNEKQSKLDSVSNLKLEKIKSWFKPKKS